MFNKNARSSGFKPRSNFSANRSSGYRGFSSSPSRFGGRGAQGNFGSGGRGRFNRRYKSTAIDVSKFINKVVITEEVVEFKPEHAFIDFKIQPLLKKAITDRGFTLPTPIQDRIIPPILDGRDVVGLANTGTGKTAAFLIPLINKALLNRNEKTLIMVPTRELATQINDELRAFTPNMNIYSVVCVGGSSMGLQIRNLKRSHHFVIGTPGRIKDLIERRLIDLNSFSNLVLDEVDRMLDMGFVGDMKAIVKQMPKQRQGLFFSATMAREIEPLIKDFLTDPLTVSVKTQEVAKNVEQDVVRVAREEKINELIKLLSQTEFSKVLVFGQTKHGVEKIYRALQDRGFRAGSIHGNKTQGQRQKTLSLFKDDRLQVLIATDVAARGLDIKDISHVINYDVPESHEAYIHRIGRTGRGDKKGKALTFVER